MGIGGGHGETGEQETASPTLADAALRVNDLQLTFLFLFYSNALTQVFLAAYRKC
jgi:hypothetical protein